jgi:glycosyltransferase involved in cell wall biosynthesis
VNSGQERGTILCLTFNDFPNKDAGSVRLLALTKALTKIGHTIKVISMGKNAINGWQQLDDDVYHMSVRNTMNGKISLLKSYLKFNTYVNREIDEIDDLKAVFAFNTMFYVFDNRRLKKLGVPLVYDSTEWYNACEFRQGIFSPEYISNSLIVKQKMRKPWRVIAISRLLEEHYRKKGLQVKKIPAVMDVEAFPHSEYVPSEKIKIVYAGSPGKKDALYMIIQGLASLASNKKNIFELRIIGATREQFVEQNEVQEIPDNVLFLGRVPRERVLEELSTADFTTFLRDNKLRFVNAGFPSKLAESMSMGVPVITNLTSDLADYLSDGNDAIIVEGFTSKDYASALIKVSEMPKEKIVEMHEKAKKTAIECFDYSNYVEDLETLIIGEVTK